MKKVSYALLLCGGLFAVNGFANENTTDDTVLTEEEVIVIDCDASPTLPECVDDSTDVEVAEETAEEVSEETTDATEEIGEEAMIDCGETPDVAECSDVELSEEELETLEEAVTQ